MLLQLKISESYCQFDVCYGRHQVCGTPSRHGIPSRRGMLLQLKTLVTTLVVRFHFSSLLMVEFRRGL